MAYISSIGTANPGTSISQGKIVEFMTRGLDLGRDEEDRLKVLYRATGIQERYSVIPDYGLNGQPYTFYPKTSGFEPFPSIKVRMEHFKSLALNLSMEAIDDCLGSVQAPDQVTHLITVSCTGMYAPGLDIELIDRLGLPPSTERTAINFMGCYAAFNALKIAQKICSVDDKAKVLVVCVELCSIHFQKGKEEETLLANSLFSDGAAAVLIESEPRSPVKLEIERFYCDLETSAKEEMTWDIGDFGFEMRLTTKVPDVIEGSIGHLTQKLLGELGLKTEDIDFFAIHPGGKRILQTIERKLEIPRERNRFAYDILRNYGNMSSPTILFVLKEIYQTLTKSDHNKRVLSFAFGPGLTLESMLLTVKT